MTFNYKKHNFLRKNGKKATIRSKQQYLVWCVLANPEMCSWPKEIKMASKLLEEFPDLKFWQSVPRVFDFKPDSLAYCLSIMGHTLLREGYPIFLKMKNVKIVPKKSEKLTANKIGEDVRAKTKPKNILDFVRGTVNSDKD